MNDARRKQIAAAVELLGQASALIYEIAAGEAEAFENLPESLQESERGEMMSSLADQLGEVLCQVNDTAAELAGCAE